MNSMQKSTVGASAGGNKDNWEDIAKLHGEIRLVRGVLVLDNALYGMHWVWLRCVIRCLL
jgi:hypothetical protein